jgi:hypothetical protein
MKELRALNVPALAFVVVGVAVAAVIGFRGNEFFDTVNQALLAVLAGMVVLAIAIGFWSSSWWATARWLVFGLMVFGWLIWLFAVVLAAMCSGLQSNAMLAEEGDPCGVLWLAVLGGFVFLLVASFLSLGHPSSGSSEDESREELIDEEGRKPTQQRIDENWRRR